MRAPKSAENTKSIAINSSPLPRNTVARNLSSFSPMRERTAPMNHRKKMPQNGTRPSANWISRRLPALVSHAPAA